MAQSWCSEGIRSPSPRRSRRRASAICRYRGTTERYSTENGLPRKLSRQIPPRFGRVKSSGSATRPAAPLGRRDVLGPHPFDEVLIRGCLDDLAELRTTVADQAHLFDDHV